MGGPPLTLATAYVRLVVDHLEGLGVDAGSLLEAHGLSEARLAESSLSLPLATWERLFLDARSVAREPALGLFVGERLVLRTHGFLGYAAMSSRNALELIDVLERFISIRISGLRLRRRRVGSELQLRLEEAIPLGSIRPLIFEAVAMSLKNTLAAVTLGACPVVSASFPDPAPDYVPLARDLLGCEPRYRQPWGGVAIAATKLDEPLRMADPHAFQKAADICERHLEGLERYRTTEARVRRLLLESRSGFPTLAATARRLHLTPRTLHRRLVDEGTSFRAIVDDVRFRLAAEHLEGGERRVEEIAYMLGYSDPSNFRRAFKRWAGVAPVAFRASASARRPGG